MKTIGTSWRYPPPRPGLVGEWDRFIGPGATKTEQLLSLIPAILGAIAISVYAYVYQLGWTPIQYTVAILLVINIIGGIITNATSSAKRWYHRPTQGAAQHIGFVAMHIIQIFLVAWSFRGMDLVFLSVVYFLLLISAIITLAVPLYIQRSVALLLVCGATFLSLYILSPTPGFEWFIPFLFIKLLVSHVTREEPYAA